MESRNLKITLNKITTKFIICAATFLLPLGLMLFLIISISLESIRKDENELKGVDVLRPAVSLMQIIPQYVRFSLNAADGEKEDARAYADDLLEELNEKYEANFGGETAAFSLKVLSE
jgi:hypothetical protein